MLNVDILLQQLDDHLQMSLFAGTQQGIPVILLNEDSQLTFSIIVDSG